MKITTPDGFIIEGNYDEVMKAYKELNPNRIQIDIPKLNPSEYPDLPEGPKWPFEPVVYGN